MDTCIGCHPDIPIAVVVKVVNVIFTTGFSVRFKWISAKTVFCYIKQVKATAISTYQNPFTGFFNRSNEVVG
ncbi:hypothetical protein D3C85_1382300 [compost metagenome]